MFCMQSKSNKCFHSFYGIVVFQPRTVEEDCDTRNPCFDGVQCYNAAGGVRCGRCPSGRHN